MPRASLLVFLLLTAAVPCHAEMLVPAENAALRWHTSYGQARRLAEVQRQMLLVFFHDTQTSETCQAVDKAFATDARLKARLRDYVLVRLPVEAEVTSGDRRIRLLDHGAFAEMHGHAGLAILDLAHKEIPPYGHVVSAFPFMQGKYYRFQTAHLGAILSLPPGTLTERTMIWAVRTHAESPASTLGRKHAALAREAARHSRTQARLGLQGHHQWETRFHRLRKHLGGRHTPVEVVAESWPGQSMIDSCLDCVASWRQSEGHWNAVRHRHALYGYDIRRGENGIWYGTGLFAN